MFRFRTTRYMNENDGSNQGSAGGAGQGAGQQQPGNSSDGTGEGGNNTQTLETFWRASASMEGAAGNGNQQQSAPQPGQQQPNNQQQAGGQQQPADMKQFIEGLNLTGGLDMAAIADGIREGNMEALNTGLAQVASATFEQAMVHANRLMDAKVEKAVNDAVQKSTGSVQKGLAVRELNEQYEFTKNPGISPIAEAALAKVMKDNPEMSVSDAVRRTGTFFQEMMKHVQSNAPADFVPPPSGPGGQPFGGAGNAQQHGNAPDWLELFGTAEGTGN